MSTSFEQLEYTRSPENIEYNFDRHILRRLNIGEAHVELDGSSRTIVDRHHALYGVVDERSHAGSAGLLAEVVKTTFTKELKETFNKNDPETSMRSALIKSQQQVREVMRQRNEADVGISGSFVKFFRDGSALKAVYAHVGDSRILLRSGLEITQVTEDEGYIDSLLHGFGHDEFNPAQVGVMTLRPKDRLVLINADVIGDTDAENFSPEEMNDIMSMSSPKTAARLFAETSRKWADKSVVVVDVPVKSRSRLLGSRLLQLIGIRRLRKMEEIYATPDTPWINSVPDEQHERLEVVEEPEYIEVINEPDSTAFVQHEEATLDEPVRGTKEPIVVDSSEAEYNAEEPVLEEPHFETSYVYDDARDSKYLVHEDVVARQRRRWGAAALLATGLLVGFVAGEKYLIEFGKEAKEVQLPAVEKEITTNTKQVPVIVKVQWPDKPVEVTVKNAPAAAVVSGHTAETFYVDAGSGYIHEIHQLGHVLVGDNFTEQDAVRIYNTARVKFGNQLIDLPNHNDPDTYVRSGDLYIGAPGKAHWATPEIQSFIQSSILAYS